MKGLAIACAAIALVLSLTMGWAIASEAQTLKVYRDPSCSCCEGWIDHLTAQGFQIESIETPDVNVIKQQYGVPNNLTSCHTAIVDGYVIEGHVPVADIKRLLAEKTPVAGLAVPGMPVGTPGMESDDQHDSFDVISFDSQGHTSTFNEYSF
jgi:hypothetical protein